MKSFVSVDGQNIVSDIINITIHYLPFKGQFTQMLRSLKTTLEIEKAFAPSRDMKLFI